MKIEINIGERSIMVVLAVITAVSVLGIALAAVPNPGHSWDEIACDKCITTSNLADNSITSAKIQDGTITSADISPTTKVPSAVNADKVGGVGIGKSLYTKSPGCGGGLGTEATCDTLVCSTDYGTVYYDCDGTCNPSCLWQGGCSQLTCQTTYWGRLLA